MKIYSFCADKWQAEWMFSAIRKKSDVIVLLMKTIKLMLVSLAHPEENIVGQVTLHVDKMSRLFFFSEGKYFSINFPFIVKDINGQLGFSSKSGYIVDSKATSEILGIILSQNLLSSETFDTFFDLVLEAEENNRNTWSILKELILFEDGYIRYDHDVVNEDGALHPLHHLDIFYSSGNSFKIGLASSLRSETMIDILNINTDCHYLRPK